MYITFLWHHIPSADGSLTHFCRRKIEKRLNQVVRKKVDKAIAKEQKTRLKQVATGGTGASVGMPQTDYKRQPTLPVLDPDDDIIPSPVSRQTTRTDITTFGARPASPFGTRPESPFGARPASPRPSNVSNALRREPTIPDILGGSSRPDMPSRNTTQSSLHSNASYSSDVPLMSSAGDMGYDRHNSNPSRNGPSRMESERSMSSSRPPFSRNFPDMSRDTQRTASAEPTGMGPPPRPGTSMSGRSKTSTPYPSQRPGRIHVSRDPSSTSLASSQRRAAGPPGFSRMPTQEYEMHTPSTRIGTGNIASSSGGDGAYAPLSASSPHPPSQPRNFTQPYRAPPMDYFGESQVPPRAGTAPVVQAEVYDDSIYDAYGAEESRGHHAVPYRSATTGPERGGGSWNGRGPYNPPRF